MIDVTGHFIEPFEIFHKNTQFIEGDLKNTLMQSFCIEERVTDKNCSVTDSRPTGPKRGVELNCPGRDGRHHQAGTRCDQAAESAK
jgi:hypothetical protein